MTDRISDQDFFKEKLEHFITKLGAKTVNKKLKKKDEKKKCDN